MCLNEPDLVMERGGISKLVVTLENMIGGLAGLDEWTETDRLDCIEDSELKKKAKEAVEEYLDRRDEFIHELMSCETGAAILAPEEF